MIRKPSWWKLGPALAVMVISTACAEQAGGLRGAAVPQEAPVIDESGQPAVDAAQPVATPGAQGELLTDTLGASAPDAAAALSATTPRDVLRQAVDAVRPAYLSDAAARKIRIVPASFTLLSDGRSAVMNGVVENFHLLTANDFSRGAIIGYVYLSSASGAPGCNPCPTVPPRSPANSADTAAMDPAALLPANELPSGYYAARVTTDRSVRTGRVELLDRNGVVVAQLPATISNPPKPSALPNAGGGKYWKFCITIPGIKSGLFGEWSSYTICWSSGVDPAL